MPAAIADASDGLPYAVRWNWPVQAWRLLLGPPDAGFNGGPVLNAPADQPLRHHRFGVVADRFQPNTTFDYYLPGTWNYLGAVSYHFGHIVSEIVHRILPARRIFEHDQWLAVAPRASPAMTFESAPAAYRDVLSLFGIGAHNLKIINRDMIVQRLNIVAQGAQLGSAPVPAYLEDLRKFTNTVLAGKLGSTPTPDRIYVSRSGIDRAHGNFLGEACFEAWLAEEGFTVFHPEDHSFLEQLRVYRQARILVFAEGSACHGVEVLGPEMLGHVCLLPRRPDFLAMFRSGLAPRARSYEEVSASRLLDSIVIGVDGQPVQQSAQALLDLDILAAKMREFGVSRLAERDGAQYLKCAAEDFDKHVVAQQRSGSRIDLDAVDRINTLLGAPPTTGFEPVTSPAADPTVLPDLAGLHYVKAIEQLHRILQPETYLEIGTAEGETLRLAAGRAVGVDPDMKALENPISGKLQCSLFQMTSDFFFQNYDPIVLLGNFIELSFLDGMHHFEFLLRDFINTEKSCGPNSAIMLHDCVPTDAGIAERANDPNLRPHHPYWWTGDVWKIIPILRTCRPDLKISVLDASPTGLVVVQGLNPKSLELTRRFDEMYTKWFAVTLASYGVERYHSQLNTQSTEVFLADLETNRPRRQTPAMRIVATPGLPAG